MRDVTASRTLVKSHPELWTECSDAGSLARHLDCFGEIRITRLEPETAVAWEGEHASGTVRLEPSGWGTRVVLTATPTPPPGGESPPVEPEAATVEPEAAAVDPEDATVEPEAAIEPEAVAEPQAVLDSEAAPDPEPAAVVSTHVAPPVTRGVFARLRGLFGSRPAPIAQAQPMMASRDPNPDPDPEPPASPGPESRAAVPPASPGPEPDAAAPPASPGPEPDAAAPPALTDPVAALTAALDSLGQAHHRPFSRS